MRIPTLHHRVFTTFLGSSFFLALFLVMPTEASAASRASNYWRYSGSMSRTTSTYYRPYDDYNYNYGRTCYSYDRYGNCDEYNDDYYGDYDDYDYRYADYRNDDCYSYDRNGRCIDYNDDYYNDDYYNDDYYYGGRYNDDYYRNSRRSVQGSSSITTRRTVNQGDTFGLALPGNRDSSYRWKANFDSNALPLRSRGFNGDWEVFTFKAQRRGTYNVTFTYGRSGDARLQTVNYVVEVR